MQRTVNYDLCQYEGSDKTSYLVNYNGDMLKIDTAIKAAADAASAAQTKADGADGKADTNAGNIATLNTQINGDSGLATDVSTLQGSVNTITSLIGNGEPTTTDKTLIGAINELNGNEGTLSSLTTTEKSNLVGAINEVNGKYSGKSVFSPQYNVSVIADGTETLADLVKRLHTAVNTVIHSLDANVRFIPIRVYSFNYGAIPCRYAWSVINNADNLNIDAQTTFVSSVNGHVITHEIFSDGTTGYVATNDNGTTTDDSAVVPTQGDVFYFDYRLEFNA